MIRAKQDFQERFDEINKYFDLLDNIIVKEAILLIPDESGDRKERFDSELIKTLKSSAILLLYNVVESTVSNCLYAIHEAFSSENLKFNELSDKLQNIFIQFYFKNIKEGKLKEESIIQHIKIMIDTWSFDKPIQLTYEEYTKYKTGSQFAGNLEAKEIKKLANKYGVVFDKEISELASIKNKRNKLAHGELSFANCCNLDTPNYLKALKDKSLDYLLEFINAVDSFIINRKYAK